MKFFAMKMRYVPPPEDLCELRDIIVPESNARIDEEVRASGFTLEDDDILMRFIHSSAKEESTANIDEEDDDDEEEEEEEEEEEYIKKKKPSKKTVCRVTDFLNSSSGVETVKSNEIVEQSHADTSTNSESYPEESSHPENGEIREISSDKNTDLSSSKITVTRNSNSNMWIPEPKDINILEENGEYFSDEEGEMKGSVACALSEDALQRVKDKTRR